MEKQINKWSKLTNKITKSWIIEYFQVDKNETIYFDWVSNEVSGIFQFADYWINFSDIIQCYELNVSRETFFEWYDWCIDNESSISLRSYILSPQERLEQEEKYLEELKERVVLAEKEFKEALEKYL